jgi:hypothetical protein
MNATMGRGKWQAAWRWWQLALFWHFKISSHDATRTQSGPPSSFRKFAVRTEARTAFGFEL